MFSEIIAGLSRAEEEFVGQVRDSFGNSVDEQAFRPMLEELRMLELTSEESEQKVKEIQLLTIELRMIL